MSPAAGAQALDAIFASAAAASDCQQARAAFIDAVAQWAADACGPHERLDERLDEEAAEELIRRMAAPLDPRLVVDALTAVLARVPACPSRLVRFALRYAHEALATRDYSNAALTRIGLTGPLCEPRDPIAG